MAHRSAAPAADASSLPGRAARGSRGNGYGHQILGAEMNRNHTVPAGRIRSVNDAPVDPQGSVIVYWMIANRRMGWNFALQHAVDRALELRKPLVVLEPLSVDYPGRPTGCIAS